MTSFQLIPEQSRVRIDGSSSVHSIHAESVGLTGEIKVVLTSRGLKSGSAANGWVEIEVAHLRASNPLVEAETKRRIDAKRFPSIRGTIADAAVTSPTPAVSSGQIRALLCIGADTPVESYSVRDALALVSLLQSSHSTVLDYSS